MTEKLLPCPYCGGEWKLFVDFQNRYQVGCRNCGVCTDWYSREEAIAAWNRRTHDVVRCEECENWGDEYYCPFLGKTTLYNFFCGYGVRKDCSVCG